MKKQQISLIEAYDKELSAEQGQGVVKPVVPIKITGSEEDKNNLAKLVNRLAKSEHGKKVLEVACDAGVELTGLNLTDCGGCYDHSQKLAIISLNRDENKQLSTLAHELRHAEQCKSKEELAFVSTTRCDIKTQLMGQRAIEADAYTYHSLCMWELDKAGEKGLFDDIKRDIPDIAKGIEKAVRPNGTLDVAKAMENGFKGWYENTSLRDSYEEGMVDAHEQFKFVEVVYTNPKGFAISYSSEQIISGACEIDGKNYIDPDSKLLEKRHYLGVKKSFLDSFDKFFKDREKDTGLPVDKSLKEIPLTYPKKKEIPAALLKANLGR